MRNGRGKVEEHGQQAMNKILRFPMARTKEAPCTVTGASAEIFIFPGVRIERRDFNLADRVKPAPYRAAASDE